MKSVALFGTRVVDKVCRFSSISRRLFFCSFRGDESDNGFHHVEEPLRKTWSFVDSDRVLDEKADSYEQEARTTTPRGSSIRNIFMKVAKLDAERVLDVLRQDGPGFDTKAALSELQVGASGLLVKEVILGIKKDINCGNKSRCAKLGYKFFVWCSRQEGFRHSAATYHLVMELFAECEEYKAMWRLVDEMIEQGFPNTARTFNILICTCCEAGLARKVVESFIKSKNFNYRPFKHSYNAILHSLLTIHQYKLIEWVYQQMLSAGFSPDVLTYNVVMCAKYRLGKMEHFHRLLNEMCHSGFSPDLHTYNILLHILGKSNKPLGALNLMRHMKDVGIDPCVLHFTTLIDGLSRAGNLDACRYFFDEMIKGGCMPDVVCYTVMITGYMVTGELEKAEKLFDEMILRGYLPNVYTYNSMIRGFCMANRFEEACSMLKEMESRGCSPNFVVYSTLVTNLRNAGKLSEAHEILRQMVEKGRYVHLVSHIKGYKRS